MVSTSRASVRAYPRLRARRQWRRWHSIACHVKLKPERRDQHTHRNALSDRWTGRTMTMMTHTCLVLALLSAMPRTAEVRAEDNLAPWAAASTSFVSGHESLAAINDGFEPGGVNDHRHGAYGNWPQTGTQWVQYEWSRPISTAKIDVYWLDDARGVRLPKACRLLYWDGNAFVPVEACRRAGPGRRAIQHDHVCRGLHGEAAAGVRRRGEVLHGHPRMEGLRLGQVAQVPAAGIGRCGSRGHADPSDAVARIGAGPFGRRGVEQGVGPRAR